MAHRLALYLAERGWMVEVLTRKNPKSLAASEIVDGIPVHRRRFLPSVKECLRKGRFDLAVRSALDGGGDRRALTDILERSKPDVINIHFPDWQTGLIPLMRSESSSRIVVSLHGDEVMRAVRGDALQRERLLIACGQADRITACSQWLLNQVRSVVTSVSDKSTVTWNGIDADRLSGLDRRLHDRPYILGFGRFVFKKGLDLLIEAYADLAGKTDLDLVLVGEGPELDRLKRIAGDLGVQQRVFFPGRAFEQEMATWIQGARLAVVPSREEPFGIAALEVLAVGVPLVASRVGGMAEVVDGLSSDCRSILLCGPEREGLRAAMGKALEEPPDESSLSEVRKLVRSGYSWASRMKAYEDILTDYAEAQSQ